MKDLKRQTTPITLPAHNVSADNEHAEGAGNAPASRKRKTKNKITHEYTLQRISSFAFCDYGY